MIVPWLLAHNNAAVEHKPVQFEAKEFGVLTLALTVALLIVTMSLVVVAGVARLLS